MVDSDIDMDFSEPRSVDYDLPMVTRVHSIALELIFEACISTLPLLDHSLSYGPESPWMKRLRTQKALTLVCHAWRVVATQFLYRDVVFHRVSQIPALLRTLRNNASLRDLIKSLTFSCFIPESWDDVTSESITQLLGLCDDLKSLAFFAPFSEWLGVSRKNGTMLLDPFVFQAHSSSIQSLVYNDHRLYHDTTNIVPHELISLFPNLTRLVLMTYPSNQHFLDRRTFGLRFEHLRELLVRPRQGPLQRDYFEILKTWHMPRLEYVSSDFCMQPPRCRQYEHHIAFFKKFGPQIKCLDIGAAFSPMATRTHLPNLVTPQSVFFRLCTNLQHAVIALCDIEDEERYPKRQYLLTDEFTAWLDIWVPSHYFVRKEMTNPNADGCDSSQLAYKYKVTLNQRYLRPNVRLIDQALANFPDLPTVYHPNTIDAEDTETYLHHVHGISFSQSRNFIIFQEEDWSSGMADYGGYNDEEPWPLDDPESESNSSDDSDLNSNCSLCSGDWEIFYQEAGRDGENIEDMVPANEPGVSARRGYEAQITEDEALQIHSMVAEKDL